MNFILNGFHDIQVKPISQKLIIDFQPKACFIIDNSYKHNYDIARNYLTVHHFKDITLGNYGINWIEIDPLDRELLEKLAPCESIVLKMLDRLEPHIGKLDYGKRKDLFLKHVRYWSHIINRHKISHFISANIPHENYDYVIYCLCKLKNIKTIFLHQTIPDFVMRLTQITPFFPEMEEEFLKLQEKFIHTKLDDIILGERAQKVYDSQVNPGSKPSPVYMKKKTLRSKLVLKLQGLFKKFKKLFSIRFYRKATDSSLFRILLFRVFIKPFQFMSDFRYRRFYEFRCAKPDVNLPFIYLPLHLQPELSTVPLAGVFSNQLLIVQLLSQNLPKEFKIYIKENPKQSCWGRTLNFYRELVKIPNVTLVSRRYDTYKLINNCQAIATATGTAGWEGLFRGKPVLMFGDFYYQYADGVFKIRSKDDIKSAIGMIQTEGNIPTKKMMKIYLKAFENITSPGYYNSVYYQRSIENPNNAELLYKFLTELI